MTQSYYNDPRNESVIVHVIAPRDNKSMTNRVTRTVVITGKYAIQSSPREKRNITPFSARMPSFVVVFPSPRGHYANVLSAFLVNTPEDVSLLESPYALSLLRLQHPHLLLQRLHLLVE